MCSHLFPRSAVAIGLTLLAVTSLRATDLVEIKTIDPTIEVELRYAGTNNVLRRPLYPAEMPALIRPEVAARLVNAQSYLRLQGYRLKIWDAYRPKSAQDQLWAAAQNKDYVANPANGIGSLHTRGVAIDATLVHENGREAAMPTDFDDFTPAAMLRYLGTEQSIRNNLYILQRAMGKAGFLGMRTEWWHFVSKDWQKFSAIPDATNTAPGFASSPGSPNPSAVTVSSVPVR